MLGEAVWDRRGRKWFRVGIIKDEALTPELAWADGEETLSPMALFVCWGPLFAAPPTFLTLEEIS